MCLGRELRWQDGDKLGSWKVSTRPKLRVPESLENTAHQAIGSMGCAIMELDEQRGKYGALFASAESLTISQRILNLRIRKMSLLPLPISFKSEMIMTALPPNSARNPWYPCVHPRLSAFPLDVRHPGPHFLATFYRSRRRVYLDSSPLS